MMRFQDLDILDVGNSIEIIGAIYQNARTQDVLLCPFPGEMLSKAPPIPLYMSLEEWQTFIQQSDLLNTQVDTKDANGSITKAIVRKSQRQIDARLQWKMFKTTNFRCAYCWTDDSPLTVDHLVSWESGGPTIEANLLPSCRKCNKTRGNKQYSDWLEDDYYLKVSRNLPLDRVRMNEELVRTLGGIKRVYIKSR